MTVLENAVFRYGTTYLIDCRQGTKLIVILSSFAFRGSQIKRSRRTWHNSLCNHSHQRNQGWTKCWEQLLWTSRNVWKPTHNIAFLRENSPKRQSIATTTKISQLTVWKYQPAWKTVCKSPWILVLPTSLWKWGWRWTMRCSNSQAWVRQAEAWYKAKNAGKSRAI